MFLKQNLISSRMIKPMFESDSSNNGISQSTKAPIKRKTRFNMNQSSNERVVIKILIMKPGGNYIKLLKERMRAIHENVDDEAKDKLHESNQKRKICKNLEDV